MIGTVKSGNPNQPIPRSINIANAYLVDKDAVKLRELTTWDEGTPTSGVDSYKNEKKKGFYRSAIASVDIRDERLYVPLVLHVITEHAADYINL